MLTTKKGSLSDIDYNSIYRDKKLFPTYSALFPTTNRKVYKILLTKVIVTIMNSKCCLVLQNRVWRR